MSEQERMTDLYFVKAEMGPGVRRMSSLFPHVTVRVGLNFMSNYN